MPARETTIGILATAIKTLQDNPLPASINPAARAMLEGIAEEMPFMPRFFMSNLWFFDKPLSRLASRSGILAATMRTTTAPTIINAGVKDNVIPPSASALVNFRLAPGNSADWLVEMVKRIKPSNRGELEITDLNKEYLERKELYAEKFGRGFAWLDTGTHESLLDASQYIQTIEHRQGLKVACLEEIAFRQNWITKRNLVTKAKGLIQTEYGKYLLDISNT